MENIDINKLFKSLIGGYACALLILFIAAASLEACTKYLTKEKTVTVHDTIPTLIERDISVGPTAVNNLDTVLNLSPYGTLKLDIHGSQLHFSFIGTRVVDTVTHETSSIPQATIRQQQETLRKQIAEINKTSRDSNDNIRKMYGDSLSAVRKMLKDSSDALVDLEKQKTKQVLSNNDNGFWQRLKNDWWFICIGIVIGAVGIKLGPTLLKLV